MRILIIILAMAFALPAFAAKRMLVEMNTVICQQKEGLPALWKDRDKNDQHAMRLDFIGYGCAMSNYVTQYNWVTVERAEGAQTLVITMPYGDEWWVPTSRLKPLPKSGY